MQMIILNSWWTDSANTQAMAIIDTRNQALAYHPTDASKTHHSINKARDGGTLTGQTEPTPYVAPEPMALTEYKQLKIDAIDAKTRSLIMAGFTYDGNQFSMSDAAQRNWIGLGVMQALGMIAFPMTISTADEGTYSLISQNAMRDFIAAFATYQTSPSGPLGSGRILKALVDACTTNDEVDAVTDDR